MKFCPAKISCYTVQSIHIVIYYSVELATAWNLESAKTTCSTECPLSNYLIHNSAVFINFFKGARLRFQEIRGGKPSWMQNVLSNLVFQGGANAPLCPL